MQERQERKCIEPSRGQRHGDSNHTSLTLYQLGLMRNSIDVDQNQTLQIREQLVKYYKYEESIKKYF